jgi:hypothetical protein
MWSLTPDGSYTASSTYLAQFHGSHPRFIAHKSWTVHAEPKCKLLSWLTLHGKLLTTDMLASQGWTHDPLFPLCLNATEMAIQMCKDRPFTAAVCTLVQDWHGASVGPPSDNFPNISKWWDDIIYGSTSGEKGFHLSH